MAGEMVTNHTEVLNPRVVVAMIPDKGGFWVACRREPQHGMGGTELKWVFPGGRVEGDETLEQAVVREAFEEMGLTVVPRGKLLERKHPDTFVEIAYFHCERTDPTQIPRVAEKEREEIAEIELVEAGELLNRFTTNVHPVIREFILSYAQNPDQDIIQQAAD